MEKDILHLGSFRFPVVRDQATLHALISNATDFKLFWMISIPCTAVEVEVDGETDYWRPRIYLESMTFPIRDWRQVHGQRYCTTADDDDPAAIYLFMHENMEKSEIQFVSRQGTVFGVEWAFTWSGFGSGQTAGRVQTAVRLTEISVWLNGVDNDLKARKRLGEDLDLSLLTEPEIVPYPDRYPQFKFRPRS